MTRDRRGRASRAGEPEQVLYVPVTPEVGTRVRVEGEHGDHGRRSLRLRPGDAVALVDGRRNRFHGHVTGLDRRGFEVEVERHEPLAVWPAVPITLAAGVLKSTRMDTLVEKASELGAVRFVPLVLERTVARPGEDGAKHQRWERIAIESLKQSRRAELMTVAAPTSLEAFLAGLEPDITLVVAEPSGDGPGAWARSGAAGPLALVVGPEGGLTEPEQAALRDAGARSISLGNNRLRAETAGVTLLVAVLTALGTLEREA